MAATPVPSFTAPPDFPVLSDRAAGTYNSKAFAWATAWQGTTGPNVYAIANTAYLNAQEAGAQAAAAISAANGAASASEVAMGATNFKGLWSSLTGALAKPATVKHNGRFWLLLTNLADVAASEPSGSNPDWTTLDAGVEVTAQVTTNTTAVPGVRYILISNGVTLTGPAAGSMAKGEWWAFTLTADPLTCYVDFAGVPFRKQATGAARRIDTKAASLRLQYEDATQGYI